MSCLHFYQLLDVMLRLAEVFDPTLVPPAAKILYRTALQIWNLVLCDVVPCLDLELFVVGTAHLGVVGAAHFCIAVSRTQAANSSAVTFLGGSTFLGSSQPRGLSKAQTGVLYVID